MCSASDMVSREFGDFQSRIMLGCVNVRGNYKGIRMFCGMQMLTVGLFFVAIFRFTDEYVWWPLRRLDKWVSNREFHSREVRNSDRIGSDGSQMQSNGFRSIINYQLRSFINYVRRNFILSRTHMIIFSKPPFTIITLQDCVVVRNCIF